MCRYGKEEGLDQESNHMIGRTPVTNTRGGTRHCPFFAVGIRDVIAVRGVSCIAWGVADK